ncbi:MAG: PAS domain S-box protein [Desulfobacula sp.]|uniref:hybrid sensor histidine kinase/response regulator n=1 Tax=Desulfobacula sp. TaxID=2593537 RepID=UPI0025B85787|nr:PAS domain-containing sensor histidine kinase [Desulfobacula sp.]MCD4722023.1 PAS domain S-box protein [Desulfobacula sp.]
MVIKSTYQELEQRVKELEKDVLKTERLKEGLLATRQLFMDIVQSLPDPTFVIDRDKKIVVWNRAIEKMTGLSGENMIGKADNAYSIPFWGEPRQVLIDLIMDHDQDAFLPYDFIEKYGDSLVSEAFLPSFRGGDGIHVWLKASPLYDSCGNLIGAIEAIRDITEKKQTERILYKEKERLSTIFESNPHGMAMVDNNGQYLYINSCFTKITGYTLKDIPSRKEWFEKVYPDEEDRKRIARISEKDNIKKNLDENREFSIRCKNGQSKNIEFRTTYLKDQIIYVLTDVTQHMKAKEALRESEERLKVIFAANPDPVVVYDVNRHPVYLNPAFTEVFGWCLNELQGKRIPFVPMDQKKITKEKIKEIYESGNPVRFETKRLSRHGEIIDVLFSAAMIKDLKGISNGLVVNLTDIIEQKTIEEQLRQSQKMEAIGTLAGGIAHDFNNILSGIFGYAQLIEMSLNDPDKARKNLKLLVKGAQRASDLVQQILMYSRQTKHKKNPLKLFLIVKEAIKFLRSSIPATIEIQEKILSRAVVMADPTQVHQIVINLCTNAYYAMFDSGGTLTVALDDIEIAEQDHLTSNSSMPGNYVKLEVSDTGQGMDKKTLERIFDPYFTTKGIGKGTGLGLSVVDGIVKKHNGFIKAYSEVGHGSMFQVFWPVIEKKSSHNFSEKMENILPKGTEQIMLVDDETDILDTLQEILEKEGYKVAIFKDGLSALHAFTKNPGIFDLVITDMTMPQMTGEELSAKILKLRKDMPIILCTGYHENFTKDMACEIGISKYVQKPLTGQELSALVREILDGK